MRRNFNYCLFVLGGGGLGPYLAVAFVFTGMVAPVHAQRAAPCGSTRPCVEIGMEDPQHQDHYADDADHFIYCPDEAYVSVDILAEFRSGEKCDNECAHGPRSWTWTVSGATEYTVGDEEILSSTERRQNFLLSGAGDSITITCTVGPTTPGECEEYRGEIGQHDGSHAGASRSCTIKLWRLDLDVPGGDVDQVSTDPQRYWTTFASSVTTTATLVGATAISPQSNLDAWEWIATDLSDSDELATTENVTNWAGKLVRDTCITCYVRVVNGCDPAVTNLRKEEVEIEPVFRRDGWYLTSYSGFSYDESTLDEDYLFPGVLGGAIFWSVNTNANPDFEAVNLQIVTPIYTPEYPSYDASFANYIDPISSGPNTGLFYNSDPGIFEIDRMAFINKWITPGAGKPSTAPQNGPYGINYSDYLDIYTVLGQDICGCTNPSIHGGGQGNNIRYISNKWHEGFGCPDSDNQIELGHHSRMIEAIENLDPNLYDPIWKADLLWAESANGLKLKDEGVRAGTSTGLWSEIAQIHSFISSDPEEHNFFGNSYLYYNGSWSSAPGQWNNGW